MQIWVYFQAGVGGDGFANLLEHAQNVRPFDLDDKQFWRVHRIVNNQIKFYAPTIDQHGCFRNHQPFCLDTNQLSDTYTSTIEQQLTTVVMSHDVNLTNIYNSDCQEILTKNQIKVLVTTNNLYEAAYNVCIKNLLPELIPNEAFVTVDDVAKFDYVLNIQQIQQSWDYVNNFCTEIGLALDKSQYLMYKQILKADMSIIKNFDLDEYSVEQLGKKLVYQKIKTWNKTS